MSDGTVHLGHGNVKHLALRVASRVLSGLELEWEDYPFLTEQGCRDLEEAIREIGSDLKRMADQMDFHLQVDGKELLERARHGG